MKTFPATVSRKLLNVSALALALLANALVANAANISLTGGDASDGWMAPSSPVLAYDLGGPDTVIQGVEFKSWTNDQTNPAESPAGITLSIPTPSTGGYTYGAPIYPSSTAPNDPNMALMIQSGFYRIPVQLTISGLINGLYRVDLFTLSGDDERAGTTFSLNGTITDTFTLGINNSWLVQNTVLVTDGQIVIETNNANNGVLAGLVVSAVPEPTGFSLLAMSGLYFVTRRRKRVTS